MREITVRESFSLSIEEMWGLFTDIPNYPKYVAFVKSVKIVHGIKHKGMWYDISTILWIPWRYDHHITAFEPYKKIEYTVSPMTGGKIIQSFEFTHKEGKTHVSGYVRMDLRWSILDKLVGSIVEHRMRKMVEGTIKNIHRISGTASD